ncbi:hypothetical protein J4H92_01480 [Leucobacter weissii]|uniref:Large extracellular alpha-helical protein n=1 Tax=Leucobacter weissii TaxID=1983706 RepID=A0A939MGS8_9MICO|nr:DUF5719 family protein [Leucobacter weissii]MBO1900618.1 hypothetical protein [Leucobacter weissii]
MSGGANRVLVGGLRAATGVLIIAAAAAMALFLGAVELPAVERDPVAIQVDTRQNAEQIRVCAGSFAELGADPERSGTALPVGTAAVVQAGSADEQFELEREEPGGSAPQVFRAAADETFAAAQRQDVSSDNLRGLTALACAEPLNEQWLVGGATSVGVSTTLNLGNPYDVPATVELTVYDEEGELDAAQTSGVLVPARGERVVSLNGYAPGRERLAVRVVSTGAAVTASLGVGQVDGLSSFAVDTVTRQAEAQNTLVVPGIVNLSEHEHGPGDAGELDAFPVVVRALSASGEAKTARVRALLGTGGSEDLGTLEFDGAAVAELIVRHWPEEAHAIVIEADAPIVGGVLASADAGGEHDYAWYAPAPELPEETEHAVAVVDGGSLVIANPGSSEAEVRVSGAKTDPSDYVVPAGGAMVVRAPADARLSSTVPVFATVRVASRSDLAAYPVLAAAERTTALTVYPR